jgi:hypothetical protein
MAMSAVFSSGVAFALIKGHPPVFELEKSMPG